MQQFHLRLRRTEQRAREIVHLFAELIGDEAPTRRQR
jgi:hypothetical protein